MKKLKSSSFNRILLSKINFLIQFYYIGNLSIFVHGVGFFITSDSSSLPFLNRFRSSERRGSSPSHHSSFSNCFDVSSSSSSSLSTSGSPSRRTSSSSCCLSSLDFLCSSFLNKFTNIINQQNQSRSEGGQETERVVDDENDNDSSSSHCLGLFLRRQRNSFLGRNMEEERHGTGTEQDMEDSSQLLRQDQDYVGDPNYNHIRAGANNYRTSFQSNRRGRHMMEENLSNSFSSQEQEVLDEYPSIIQRINTFYQNSLSLWRIILNSINTTFQHDHDSIYNVRTLNLLNSIQNRLTTESSLIRNRMNMARMTDYVSDSEEEIENDINNEASSISSLTMMRRRLRFLSSLLQSIQRIQEEIHEDQFRNILHLGNDGTEFIIRNNRDFDDSITRTSSAQRISNNYYISSRFDQEDHHNINTLFVDRRNLWYGDSGGPLRRSGNGRIFSQSNLTNFENNNNFNSTMESRGIFGNVLQEIENSIHNGFRSFIQELERIEERYQITRDEQEEEDRNDLQNILEERSLLGLPTTPPIPYHNNEQNHENTNHENHNHDNTNHDNTRSYNNNEQNHENQNHENYLQEIQSIQENDDNIFIDQITSRQSNSLFNNEIENENIRSSRKKFVPFLGRYYKIP